MIGLRVYYAHMCHESRYILVLVIAIHRGADYYDWLTAGLLYSYKIWQAKKKIKSTVKPLKKKIIIQFIGSEIFNIKNHQI